MDVCNIPVTGREALAANHSAWRQCTVSGSGPLRNSDWTRDAKRHVRKNRSVNPTAAVACSVCGQVCATEFRLLSHQRHHWHNHFTMMMMMMSHYK